jgi:hypothetical protein
VNSFYTEQVVTGGPNAQSQFQQNIQQGQSQMQQLKNKLVQLGGGSSDDIMPQGFKPNNQKTKSFLKSWSMEQTYRRRDQLIFFRHY